MEELPKNWDWRNVNGTNYLSVNRNERAPKYCASCWAVAATSVLSDRINIITKKAFPDVLLSTQVFINCEIGGNCSGGNSISLYHYA
jgi:cathepsin X